MTRQRNRNLQLDVLRGVAILLVFGRHLTVPTPDGPVGMLAAMWHRIGWLGVDLFFVLSGFLIGGLLIAELQQRGRINVGRFLIRRGLKLYPGYFVFIGYLMLMPVAKALARGESGWSSFSSMLTQLWPNFIFLQNYLGSPAGHTWSLAVEEHFYLLLPFGLATLAATGRMRLLVPLCLATAPVFLAFRILSVSFNEPFSETMSATHLRLDGLLFGVGVRGVAQFVPAAFQAFRHWRGVLGMTGVLLWLPNAFIEPDTALIRTVGLTGTLLGSAAFLTAAYHTHGADFGRYKKYMAPVASMVAWIGVYSYGIYLWHVTVFGILERELAARVTVLAGISELTWLVSTVGVCSGAVLAGAIATRVVEVPVLQLRDRIFPSHSTPLPPNAEKSRQGVARLDESKEVALQVTGELSNEKAV